MPSLASAGRLSGEPTGSRQSSNGSRRADSHSKVEEFIRKNSLKESGFWGMYELNELTWSSCGPGSSSWSWWVRLRFLERERRKREEMISEVERKWWIRGKSFSWELGGELVRERGFEEGKRRRRRRVS